MFILLITTSAFAQERRTTPAPLFEELEQRWLKATHEHDGKALEAILAQEFTFTANKMLSRSEYLAALEKHPEVTAGIQDLTARVYCNTGVVKFRMTSPSVTLLVTDIWNESTDGTWRAVARHLSQEK